jgi:tetratricopeptide (TPR) repeat protein
MKLARMKKTLSCIVLLTMAGCAVDNANKVSFLESRQKFASELEQQKHYADALMQWKILQVAYPDDPNVDDNQERLSRLIEKKVAALSSTLLKAQSNGNNSNKKLTALKMLALETANTDALDVLREMEWDISYEAASVKTATIKKKYQVKQKKSKRRGDIGRFIALAETYAAEQNSKALLDIADKFIDKFPHHQKALEFRFQALSNLGNELLAKGREEKALEYFEQALVISGVDKSSLDPKVNSIKKRLSKNYFVRGMKAFKIDINKSVELLQLSVKYNPNDHKAKQQLMKASRIQKNLNRIKANSG